ncbi:MAG: tryptophan 2,3-dioxygenase [Sphingomonadales bacterium]|nr:tryptophan 2,3-dioxygenase [Sphingomonadales bacterium]
MSFSPDILHKLEQLQAKYEAMGQDLGSYLEGLLQSDFLPYWDYVQLDVLLNLQKPKTAFEDEKIFILYHQITELYFKLCLNELAQLCRPQEPPSTANVPADEVLMRIQRVNRYFDALTLSFSIMTDGMDPEQFLKFRMALLPASGFQSAQYREIELHCTELQHLVHRDFREALQNETDTSRLYARIYWKQGAIELQSGKKTLTLTQFEAKYDKALLQRALSLRGHTLAAIWHRLSNESTTSSETLAALAQALRILDHRVNVDWPLAHYRTAVRYLHRPSQDIAATGGTNWQQYLPPRMQLRIFYPWLWTETQLESWGKKDLLRDEP